LVRGARHWEKADENQKIRGLTPMQNDKSEIRYAVCINDGGYIDDLKVRTIYKVLPDESAARSHYLRIVDETGEDYLYPEIYFVLIDVPREVEEIFASHA
jgi:hypothetical protein